MGYFICVSEITTIVIIKMLKFSWVMDFKTTNDRTTRLGLLCEAHVTLSSTQQKV